MSDQLSHYHMFDFKARAVVALVTDATREAQARHALDPLATIALGRALACVTLLGSTLKRDKEYIVTSFGGGGLLTKVIAECHGSGHLRGYTIPARIMEGQPEGTPVPSSVGQAIGPGLLTVTRGVTGEAEPYQAIIDLMSGEIASDVARYLTESEQIPSAIAAGVKLGPKGEVLAAGGVLVQRLGGAVLPEETLVQLEERLQTMALSERLARGETPDQIIAALDGAATDWGLLSTRALSFQCTCSRDKMAAALTTVPLAQLREIEASHGGIEARCPFCGNTERFRANELVPH